MSENGMKLRTEIRVLIVDDSATVRTVLTSLLESDPDIRVIGQASTGAEAVELTASLRPDLVTMDLMMPGMDGMEATHLIMARHPTPVLFLSAYFGRSEGAYTRGDALAAGALDVIEKPALIPDWRWRTASHTLIQKVKSLSKVPVIAHIHGARKLLAQEKSQRDSFHGPAADVVVIGASAGGSIVLEELLSMLPATYALGVLVVQHITGGAIASVSSLQDRCALPVKMAEEGDAIVPRRVLVTPESSHMVVQLGGRVHLSNDEPVNGHRPSIDVTFKSLAKVYGARSAGILLTGMGSDGAAGLLAVREVGGVTMVQDEASCAAFAMPRAAIELGAAQQVLSPAGLSRGLNALHVERVRSLI